VIRLDTIEDILNYSQYTNGCSQRRDRFKELVEEIRSNHKFMEGANRLKLQIEIQKATFISDKKE
jgi:hypothetical protein